MRLFFISKCKQNTLRQRRLGQTYLSGIPNASTRSERSTSRLYRPRPRARPRGPGNCHSSRLWAGRSTDIRIESSAAYSLRILCECPLTSRPRAGSCDEAVTEHCESVAALLFTLIWSISSSSEPVCRANLNRNGSSVSGCKASLSRSGPLLLVAYNPLIRVCCCTTGLTRPDSEAAAATTGLSVFLSQDQRPQPMPAAAGGLGYCCHTSESRATVTPGSAADLS